MDTPKKLMVGYDLCDDASQISCFSYKSMEPVAVGCVPTVLCLKTDTRQWLYGEEAKACAGAGGGTLVEHLPGRLISGEVLELLGQRFDGVALLEKYFRKTLTIVKEYFPIEPITRLVVTVRDAGPAMTGGICAALSLLGLEKDRVTVMSHGDACLYYALSQEPSLWMNDVGLFDLNEDGLSYYRIRLNRRTKPIIACLEKTDYTRQLDYATVKRREKDPAYLLENITGTALHAQLVTTLYFTGKGFEGGWAQEVIKGLCNGRRAFMGQNLYTYGACYAAKELSGDGALEKFLLIGEDMLMASVGLRVYSDTGYHEAALAQAGETWYEVNKSIEVIPEGVPELELVVRNSTGEIIRERVQLTGLPKRPDRMTRLKISLTCRDRAMGVVTVDDLGFGEFYPGTGTVMELTVEI